jgi:phthiodiolone/phenolphthiodiolone dimycocerosates ketoreductase
VTADQPLEIGLAAPARPPAAAIVGAARRREEQGIDAVWWADHLLHWFPESIWTPDLVPQAAAQPTPHVWIDPFPAVAAAAAGTERIRMGIGVTDMVRRHPAALAQTALTLDHLTGGRFILGVGTGEAINLTPFGLANERPLGRVEEGLEIMRALFASDGPVDFAGDHFTLRGATMGLAPVGDDPPPVWMAAHRPRGLEVTGRLADGWLPLGTTPDEYAAGLARVRAAAAAARRPASAITPGVYLRVVLADDRDAARRAIDASLLMRFIALTRPAERFAHFGATHPIGPGLSGIGTFLPMRYDRDAALALADRVPVEVVRDTVIHGAPADVAAEVAAFVRAGARHVQLVNMTPLADPSLTGPSDGHLTETVALVRAAATGG